MDRDMQEPEYWDWVEYYNGKNVNENDDSKSYKEDIEFKRYFLVDYENVNRDGLNGITQLYEEDCVRIYYSESAETLTFGLHRRINESRAYFQYIKVRMPIKNAIDCKILFDLSDIIKENKNVECYIVSKDGDFDKAIEVFNIHNLSVKKVEEICRCDEAAKKEVVKKTETKSTTKRTTKKTSGQNEKDKREAQVRSFFGQHFKEKEYKEHKEDIIQTLLDSKTKQEINIRLMKVFPSKVVSEIHKKLRPLIKDLPGK